MPARRSAWLAAALLAPWPLCGTCTLKLSLGSEECGAPVLSATISSDVHCEALCGGDTFEREACVPTPDAPEWVEQAAEIAGQADAALLADMASFTQVCINDANCANSACRWTPEDSADYFDSWYTETDSTRELYNNRELCERACRRNEMNPPDAGYECVAYEFRDEWDAGASEWRGVCEKWRVGPVFASETNGPRSQGGTQPRANDTTCW